MFRKKTREIRIGSIKIGGNNPVAVQSMLNAPLDDVSANVMQTIELYNAGCDINRLAILSAEDIKLIPEVKAATPMPLVADIQYNYKFAIEAAHAGADKVRINPGNIGDRDRVAQVVRACKAKNIPIRIGVNSGSLEKDILSKYGKPTAEALVESAIYNVRLLERFDFGDIVISIKSSSVKRTMEAYRALSVLVAYPLHLGVTEAGTPRIGTIKSAAALGSLLADGIGDTIRVSLTGSPTLEPQAARDILQAVERLENAPVLISCPTCGRTKISLIEMAEEVERAVAGCRKKLKIAVMGCVVNGPGEAADADIGIAGGTKYCIIFKHGKEIAKVPPELAVQTLLAEIEKM